MFHIDWWPWGAMLAVGGWALAALLMCLFIRGATHKGKNQHE